MHVKHTYIVYSYIYIFTECKERNVRSVRNVRSGSLTQLESTQPAV